MLMIIKKAMTNETMYNVHELCSQDPHTLL